MAEAAYPVPAFHFRVVFGAGKGGDASFVEVDGLERKLEVETVVEGGENRFAHRLPKGMASSNLVLKRGIADGRSRLVQWCRDVLEGNLVKRVETRSLEVHLLDEQAEPLYVWALTRAYPVSWIIEPFGSTKNEVALERIELAYAYIERVK
ncbi:MAG: phage tail protein [Pseudomonadota bacterium]